MDSHSTAPSGPSVRSNLGARLSSARHVLIREDMTTVASHARRGGDTVALPFGYGKLRPAELRVRPGREPSPHSIPGFPTGRTGRLESRRYRSIHRSTGKSLMCDHTDLTLAAMGLRRIP